MTEASGREPAHGLFQYGLFVIAAIAAADLLGLPGGASVGQLLLLAGIPFWAIFVAARRAPLFDPAGSVAVSIILAAALGIATVAMITAIWAAEPFRVFRVFVAMIAALAVYCFAVGTWNERRMIHLAAFLVAAIGAVSLLSIAGALYEPLAVRIFNGTDRAHGTFKNPNQFGMVISTIGPVAAGLALSVGGRIRLLSILSLVAMLVALQLSGSKANLLFTGAGLAMFAILAVILRFRGVERLFFGSITLAALLALGVAGASILEVLNPRAAALLSAFFNPELTVPSIQSRQFLWQESLRIFNENAWLGEGAGQPLLSDQSGKTISHSHNLFLDYARTMGAAGLVLAVILIGTIVIILVTTLLGELFRASGDNTYQLLLVGSALGAGNYLAANQFSESFGPSTSPLFWLVLFLFSAVRGHIRRSVSDRRVGTQARPAPA